MSMLRKGQPAEDVRDPDGRYRRCEIIGNGAFKIVYRAYDQEEGIEVAWNEIRLGRFKESETKQIQNEIKLLGDLSHPRILRLFNAWIDKTRNVLVFITEFFTNGTIRSYISDVVRTPTRSVIGKWCRQVLDALNYMHSHNPAVVHRDLKCDNLFIDASEGIVKIGDFGLSRSISSGEEAQSKLGTPAYTAPEVYTGKYTTKADLWSFGLCVLEMVTGETPYAECTNIGAIYMKVTTGGLPAALTKVGDPVIVDFITQCLLPAEARASAAHLLEHSLILGVDPEQMAIEPPIRTDDDEVVDFEEPLHLKEYADLVERQKGAMEKLRMDHREQRIALRAAIRARVGRGN